MLKPRSKPAGVIPDGARVPTSASGRALAAATVSVAVAVATVSPAPSVRVYRQDRSSIQLYPRTVATGTVTERIGRVKAEGVREYAIGVHSSVARVTSGSGENCVEAAQMVVGVRICASSEAEEIAARTGAGRLLWAYLPQLTPLRTRIARHGPHLHRSCPRTTCPSLRTAVR